ncbi:MAG: hypothetical protein SPI12_05710 [Actinomycetaceae bacterium]|nr:hypothetical protein [Actinomycetaceae bacterium]MDY6083334.1 hypothetical protein [Actinomycetaceae bacterium]
MMDEAQELPKLEDSGSGSGQEKPRNTKRPHWVVILAIVVGGCAMAFLGFFAGRDAHHLHERNAEVCVVEPQCGESVLQDMMRGENTDA